MEVQAALHSDIAVVFDECTPFHVSRDYTARSTERTHRWLERCLRWHDAHGPRDQVVYGIVQGGVEHDLRTESAATRRRTARATGSRSAARSGTTSHRCTRSSPGPPASWSGWRPSDPATCSGSATSTTCSRGVELGIDTFDCAMPTRLGRHGVALIPDPAARWRVDLVKAPLARGERADPRRLPLPGVRGRATHAPTSTTCCAPAS